MLRPMGVRFTAFYRKDLNKFNNKFMTNEKRKKRMLRLADAGKSNIIGRFENMYGEEFVFYKRKDSNNIFVTGDEFDWVGGHKIKTALPVGSLEPMFLAVRDNDTHAVSFNSVEEQNKVRKLLKDVIEEVE